jgi:hypothetical protein
VKIRRLLYNTELRSEGSPYIRRRVRDSTPTDESHMTVKEIDGKRERRKRIFPLTLSTVIAIYAT